MTLEAVIAANRFGLGARPGELQAIGGDPRGWLARQVAGSRPIPKDVASLPSSAQAFRVFADGQQQRRSAKQAADEGDIAKRIGEKIRTQLVPLYQDQVAARYRVAVHTEEPFRERLVHFWTNHFAVSADKVQVIALAGTLENEAIRPNLGGSFLDMLLAVESHPAMILYLDNQASVGPNSPLAHRVAKRLARKPDGRKLDINENLAREILELHTLGVNGGYTQTDVTTFARALTGWSIGSERGPIAAGEPGKFEFRDMAHEPGAKTILGHKYSEEGVAQPRTVLRDLARHPATAQHIATKLARHFVADEPSQGVVDKLAKVFLDSNGDLPTLHRALIDIPQAWANATAKFKTPHDFVVSTYRMLDFVPAMPQQILAPFQLLGQRPYAPGSPAGWPDTAGQWDGPDALLKRIEWADQIGQRTGTRFQPLDLGLQSLGAALAERTRTAITRAESAAQGITLLLASPDFQRR